MKKCTRCKDKKPIDEFNKNKNKADGRETRCRECAIKAGKKYRKERKAAGRKYVPRDPDRSRRVAADWRKENPERMKAKAKRHWLKKKYGITIHEYTRMFNDQRGRCYICDRDSSEFKKGLAVDHCHKTGKVRQLLCGECNTALGKLQENPMILLKAYRYLKLFNAVESESDSPSSRESP